MRMHSELKVVESVIGIDHRKGLWIVAMVEMWIDQRDYWRASERWIDRKVRCRIVVVGKWIDRMGSTAVAAAVVVDLQTSFLHQAVHLQQQATTQPQRQGSAQAFQKVNLLYPQTMRHEQQAVDSVRLRKDLLQSCYLYY